MVVVVTGGVWVSQYIDEENSKQSRPSVPHRSIEARATTGGQRAPPRVANTRRPTPSNRIDQLRVRIGLISGLCSRGGVPSSCIRPPDGPKHQGRSLANEGKGRSVFAAAPLPSGWRRLVCAGWGDEAFRPQFSRIRCLGPAFRSDGTRVKVSCLVLGCF